MSAAAEAPKAPSGKKALLIPIVGAVVVTAALTGGGMFFLMPSAKPAKHAPAAEGDEAAAGEHGAAAEGEAGEAEGEDAKKGPAIYHPMTPSFVVNIGDSESSHFLQIEMQLRARNAAAVEALKLHDPQIRNALLMLLGAQTLPDISSREAKEVLQKKVLEEIQRILKAETGKTGIDAVYFTSFVMQ
ncbi:flagellar basal body-associated FliL family protein [Nevskia sp.]|uniref:flagellar basal body-associated FliL family protein n=1 Tax=Nevskia sp. TaxID=1929292 RepID=UPI0025E38930|nr:flagellar basal body-associated FliL family protein [Nevskia sp.]